MIIHTTYELEIFNNIYSDSNCHSIVRRWRRERVSGQAYTAYDSRHIYVNDVNAAAIKFIDYKGVSSNLF